MPALFGRPPRSWLCLLVIASFWMGCEGDPRPTSIADGARNNDAGLLPPSYRATVRRTSMGVPHIQAGDMASLGFGYGYVFAEDNLCNLAEELLTVRGERAKYFGDVGYDLGNTSATSNVNSDAVYRMLAPKEIVERERAALSAELQGLVHGYAAGVSRYIRELKSGRHPGRHVACRDQPFVREIDDADLYRRLRKLALLGSSATFLDGIAAARPAMALESKDVGTSLTREHVIAGLHAVAPKLLAYQQGETGSNMYAFGSELTGAGGILLGNPHYPWYGSERLYQVHLTVPGRLDVQGGSLYGTPLVSIGFTANFAWSHTVSTGYRFTPYALKLKPGDPFTYIQDGQEKKIQALDFPIEVKQPDGSLQTVSVRLYRSEYGPMVYLGNSAFQWSQEYAFTLRDANDENQRLLRQSARWNMAASLAEFAQIQAEELALPWVNTSAADNQGNVYYADVTVVPNVPDALAERCKVAPFSAALEQAAPGLPMLDGSRSECSWQSDPDAPQPGIFGPSHLPRSERKDWVLNCNDSHWLTNPRAPLTGYARIIGREGYEQSLRTRLCHQQVLDRLAGSDGLQGTNVSVEAVKQLALGARVYTAERFKKLLLDGPCTSPSLTLTRDPLTNAFLPSPLVVEVTQACEALRGWDDRNDVQSRGSLVWDEFWFRVEAVRAAGVAIYANPFDAADPLGTPSGLKVETPELIQAFAAAVRSIREAGFAFDAPRSVISYREGKGGSSDRIPVPGGFQRTGNFAIAQVRRPVLKPGIAYGAVTHGNSYLQVVGYGPAGVEAHTIVTYSLSTDPASPHYDDYTRIYGQKQWLRAAFSEAEVAADTKLTLELSE